MTHLSDAHHFRKMVAGLCMIFAPLLLVIGMVIHPESSTNEATQLGTIAANQDAWFIAHLLILASLVLALPAVLGLMHMLREREVALGHIGGGLALIGVLALVGIVTIDGFVLWQAASGGEAGMVALYERLNETAGVVIPFYIVSFAFTLGLLCLAFGLYRARAVQSWMAVFITAGAICLAIGGPAALNWLMIVGAAFLLVGLGSVGRMVFTESDEDWEHTPEYRGFKPLAGMR